MESTLGEITLIQIADLGKIKFMSLRVEGERLVRFVGPNEAGKSTVLDRLQNLFTSASAVPKGIIRKGIYQEGAAAGQPINRGKTRVETSNGYVIEQIIRNTKSGEQKAELHVTHNGMPIDGGALSFLKTVSTKYPDPHKVANMSGQELFKELFSILNIDLSEFDAKIAKEKEKASEARATLKVLGAEKPRPEGVRPTNQGTLDINVLQQQRRKADIAYQDEVFAQNDMKKRYTDLKTAANHDEREISEMLAKIEILKTRIAEAREKADLLLDKIDEDMVIAKKKIIEELDAEIAAAASSGDVVRIWDEYEKDYLLRKESTSTIENAKEGVLLLEERKKDALANAPVPAINIQLTESGSVVKVDGDTLLEWDTLSMSARLTAATELCIATIPDGALRAIYIERGESIGTEYRKVIADLAAKEDVMVFMEVFSETPVNGDGVFMLEEGQIIESNKKPPSAKEPPIQIGKPVEGPVSMPKTFGAKDVSPSFTNNSPDAIPVVKKEAPIEKTFDLF